MFCDQTGIPHCGKHRETTPLTCTATPELYRVPDEEGKKRAEAVGTHRGQMGSNEWTSWSGSTFKARDYSSQRGSLKQSSHEARKGKYLHQHSELFRPHPSFRTRGFIHHSVLPSVPPPVGATEICMWA